MTHAEEPSLEIHVFGYGWQVNLRVEPNLRRRIRAAEFELPQGRGTLTIPVDYGEATDDSRTFGVSGPHDWHRWFVKIYRCRTTEEANALLAYLLDQARDIQRANAALGGAARTPFTPPWATVPVHIVRGDLRQTGFDDLVVTQLTIPVGVPQPSGVAERTWPSWFVSGQAEAERTVLAIAPWVEQITWELDGARRPGVQHLASFRDMARGLDTLHELGIVHCDITPSNVCRYDVRSDHGFIHGFVLVDVDAAVRLSAPPHSPRTFAPFAHRSMRVWLDGLPNDLAADAVPDRGTLLANDRFGFALVVLSALAGEQWVRNVLLRSDNPDGRRIADNPDAVAEALGRLWRDPRGNRPDRTDHEGDAGEPDNRWAALIQVLTEPFGPQIEASDWSAAGWLKRVIGAGRARPNSVPEVASQREIRHKARVVERIRQDVRAQPTTDPDQMVLGYRAAEVAAQRAAAMAARWTLAGTALVVVGLDAVVMLSWLVLGK